MSSFHIESEKNVFDVEHQSYRMILKSLYKTKVPQYLSILWQEHADLPASTYKQSRNRLGTDVFEQPHRK